MNNMFCKLYVNYINCKREKITKANKRVISWFCDSKKRARKRRGIDLRAALLIIFEY